MAKPVSQPSKSKTPSSSQPSGSQPRVHNPAQFYDVVCRPLVTEKSTSMQALRNQFSFEVAPSANKVEVRKAVEALFSVKVLKVNMVSMPHKARRMFGRPGQIRPWKKAVVTLRKGDTIDVA